MDWRDKVEGNPLLGKPYVKAALEELERYQAEFKQLNHLLKEARVKPDDNLKVNVFIETVSRMSLQEAAERKVIQMSVISLMESMLDYFVRVGQRLNQMEEKLDAIQRRLVGKDDGS